MDTGKIARALAWIALAEGGYVRDPADAGGETYRGIARASQPGWSGWAIIDAAKALCASKAALEAYLTNHAGLQAAVTAFYGTRFWDRLGLDDFPCMTGLSLYDCVVNHGRGVELIQRCINEFYGHRYPDALVMDNVWGPATRGRVLEIALGPRPAQVSLFESLLTVRQAYYNKLGTEHPEDMRFEAGWHNRLETLRAFVSANCTGR